MTKFTLNLSDDELTELQAAFKWHLKRDVEPGDIKRWVVDHLDTVVQKYRESERNKANPVDVTRIADA